MRRFLSLSFAVWISVSPFLNGMLKVALAAPTVAAPVLSVSSVPVGVATQIIATSKITSGPGDPAVVATGVNLLRVDASNVVLSTVGTMRDDGLSGDALAGDGEFTLRFTVTESAAGVLRVRVSAPFRGVSLRVLSPVGSVPVQVAQNQPPTFTSTPPASATVGLLYSYQATAQDPEGGALKFQRVSGPTGLTIGQTTGLVQWTPTASQVGKQNVAIKVSDPKGAAATQNFTVSVAANQPPAFTSAPPTSGTVGVLYSYQATGQDPEGGAQKFQLITGPSGMLVSQATGLVQWTPTKAQVGNQSVQLRISDPQGLSANQNYTVQVAALNQPPMITSAPNTTATEGSLYQYQVIAQDPEKSQLSYQLLSAPSGMTIGQSTGLIQWTPAKAQVGTQNVQLKVADPQNAAATQNFTIQVAAANLGPVITSNPITTAKENTLYQYQVAAQDPEKSPLSYQLLSAPSGMTIGQSTGLIQWTPVKAQVGAQSVQLKVADPQNAAATQNFTIQVAAANQGPLITSVPLATAKTTLLYLYQVAAQDPEGGTLTHQLVSGPAGMTINATSGRLQWMPTTAQIGNQNVQLKVIDAQGAEAAQNFTVAVTELNLSPTITSLPTTFAKTSEPYVYNVTAYDPEKKSIQFSFSETQPAGMTINSASGSVSWSPSISQIGSYRIAVRATDPGGAFDTQAFNLKVLDPSNDLQIISPTGPQSIRIDQTLTLPLQSNYTGAAFSVNPSLTNGSVAGANFTFKPTSDQEGVQTVTFKASYGDMQKSVVIPITVTRDNSSPVIAPIAAQTVQEGANLTFTIAATDPDSDPLTYSAPGLSLANAFFNTTARQFTFNPIVGQAGNYQVLFSVSDTRSTTQITIPIQVTKSTGQQQVLALVVDPVSNPTLLGGTTISGNITGQLGTPPPKQVPPLVTGLVPSVAKQGQALTVQITGLNTNFGQTISRADFGDGITINSLTVTSATSAQANLTIDKVARIGARTIRMLGAGSEAQSVVAFNVEKGVASITGVIIDPFTNQPLAGARVSINGTTLSALTDSQGRFTLSGVPNGSVPLLITLPNYDVQQFSIGVAASETATLPDVIKMNALARPPTIAGTLPRAATVISVLDRGVADAGKNMSLETAKAAISDTMLVVGGNEAGVFDESGNQLNPKLQGGGMFSLTQQGVENQARMLLLGQTYRLGEILFQLRGTYSFAIKIASDSELLASLQSDVNESWANPDDPASAMALIVFGPGTTRSPIPPVLTLNTRLNSFQAFLIHASFLSYYAADIDYAITRIARAKGVPPPEVSSVAPFEEKFRGLASIWKSVLTLLQPTEVYAQELTVAERRLADKRIFTRFFTAQRFGAALVDGAIAAVAGFALAYMVGTSLNFMMGTTSVAGAKVAVFNQAIQGAIIGASLAVFQKLLISWGIDKAVEFMHPDPPIGQSTRTLDDGSVEVTFTQSSAETQTSVTLPDGTIVHKQPGGVTSNVITFSDFINGNQNREVRYEYRIFKVDAVDSKNIIGKEPLPLLPLPVVDPITRQVVAGRLKFIVPKQYVDDEVNYFRMATYQIYDSVLAPPQANVKPFTFSDLSFGEGVTNRYSTELGYLLTFASGFGTPGLDFNLINPLALLNPRFLSDKNFGGPSPNYLDPLFGAANKEVIRQEFVAREAQIKALLGEDYLAPSGINPATDVLTQQAMRLDTHARLMQLLEQKKGMLLPSVRDALQRIQGSIEQVAGNPTAILTESNAVTGEISRLLGRVGPALDLDQARIFSNFQESLLSARQASDVMEMQDSFLSKIYRDIEVNVNLAKAGKLGASPTLPPLEGMPNIGVSPTNPFRFDGQPTFLENARISVLDHGGPNGTSNNALLSIEVPGKPTRVVTLGELKEAESARKIRLQEILDARKHIVEADFVDVRRLFSSDAELGQALNNLKAVDAAIEETRFRLSTLDDRINQLVKNETVRNSVLPDPSGEVGKPRVSAKNIARFQKGLGRLGGILGITSTVFLVKDTQDTLFLSSSLMPSELSEAIPVFKLRNVRSQTARIASDPLVPDGLLSLHHLTEAEARQIPGNETRKYPIVDGSIGLTEYGPQGKTQTKMIVPGAGFPSDHFALDSEGRIYANNLNSNETFGGRIFRFTRPTNNPSPNEGAGVLREYAGSINFYSLDAFLPAAPVEPIAMGFNEFCCDGRALESPFVADIDFRTNVPEGRVRRIPIESIPAPGAAGPAPRIIGQTWVQSSDLKLETPAALVGGKLEQKPNSSGVPFFLSDGPRIWSIVQDNSVLQQEKGILKKIVDTPLRRWSGLMVDINGNLFALDAQSGEVWVLPLAVVRDALEGLQGPNGFLHEDQFNQRAFKVATGYQSGHHLARTTKNNGFFIAADGGLVVREDPALVGVLPDDVAIQKLAIRLPRSQATIDITDTIYTMAGKKRFLAKIPATERTGDRVTLIVSFTRNGQPDKFEISTVLPIIGDLFVPEDKLAQILRGQP